MVQINMQQELSFFELDKKWNDYIGAQKEIISKLKKRKIFQNLPKMVKMQKVVTIRSLPDLIREGHLLEDEVPNFYLSTGERFAYLVSKIVIDDEMRNVRIAVKKKVGSNHFYIHHIDTQKSSELLSPS